MKRRFVLLLPLAAGGCVGHGPPAHPHYVLGTAYEANGAWFYPSARYAADETGLAMIQSARDAGLTADGEASDQAALAASHPTLQLPAIARLTDLETGRQVIVRINDRGPARPDRLVAVTRRTAELLRFPPGGVARVRLEVLPAESHAAVEALGGAAEERIAIAVAPREPVQATDLPPPGVAGRAAGPLPASPAGRAAAPAAPPLRMPERITQVLPRPGTLRIDLGRFSRHEYAARRAARLPGIVATIERERRGRDDTYRVQAGPFASIAAADAAFAEIRRAGVADARIVIE